MTELRYVRRRSMIVAEGAACTDGKFNMCGYCMFSE